VHLARLITEQARKTFCTKKTFEVCAWANYAKVIWGQNKQLLDKYACDYGNLSSLSTSCTLVVLCCHNPRLSIIADSLSLAMIRTMKFATFSSSDPAFLSDWLKANRPVRSHCASLTLIHVWRKEIAFGRSGISCANTWRTYHCFYAWNSFQRLSLCLFGTVSIFPTYVRTLCYSCHLYSQINVKSSTVLSDKKRIIIRNGCSPHEKIWLPKVLTKCAMKSFWAISLACVRCCRLTRSGKTKTK